MESDRTEIITEPVSEMTCSACQHPFDVAGLPAFVEIVCPNCHTPQTVPTRIGQFLLVDLLGKGGMGAVYRGRDLSLDRWVAVKVMLSTLGANPEFVETFRREAQAAAALNHPNIVQIYSFGVAHGQPYMVMELLEGGRMDLMIARGEYLNESLVFKMGVDVAEGLNAAAAIGLIHGDVKPENILIDHNGVAKVVDFGLAQFKQQAAQPGVSGIWGTPYYIAPERIRGHPSDARSDIYSLGATLFHALALKPPFDGETAIDVVKARLKAAAPALRTVRHDADPAVEAIIARMLEVEPLRRYPTYLSLLSDMRNTLARLKPAPAAAVGGPSVSKRGGKIVLTKKKGGGGTALTHVSGPLTVGSGMAGSASGPVIPGEKPPMSPKKKVWLWGLGILLALLLIGGGATVWILHYQKKQARLAAEHKEAARIEAVRKEVDRIWNDAHALLLQSAKRVESVTNWTADAAMSLAAMTDVTNKLTDEATVNDVATNATVMAGDTARIATGSLAQALADMRGLTNALGVGRDAAFRSTNSAQAELALTTLTNLPDLFREKSVAMEADITRGAQALKALAAMSKKVVGLAQEQAAERERLEKERLAEEQRQREEERKRQQAAENEKLGEAEISLIDVTRKANVPLVQQNQFKQALEAMESLEKDFKSDAGKAALKTAVERCRMMVDLKVFIIEGIRNDRKASPDSGFRFGWLVGGVPSRDVLGADEDKVMVRGGAVPWAEVAPAQMMRFIKRYTAREGLPRREAGRQLLGAAAYVLEAGAGSEGAKKLAGDLVAEAVNADSRLKEKVRAILPEIVLNP